MPHEKIVTLPAWLILPGHSDAAVQLSVVQDRLPVRVWRTLGLATAWTTVTAAAFVITVFDPFLSSIPMILGTASVWRSWRGRFRVTEFVGACPRCDTPMRLQRGARIDALHRMPCYTCHHEPHLAVLNG